MTDRSSFARLHGSSRVGDDDPATVFAATLIAVGKHDTVREHALGAHGKEQSGCRELPSLLCSSEPGIGISGISRISDVDACIPPEATHESPLLTRDMVRSAH